MRRKILKTLLLGSAVTAMSASIAVSVNAQQPTALTPEAPSMQTQAAPVVQSPVAQLMTLQRAVAEGVKTNPEYGIVAANRRATEEELNQGVALYYPSVDVNADTGFEYTDDQNTRGRGEDGVDLYRYDMGLTITQLLLDGEETKYEVQRQKARVNSASHRVTETMELVGLSIVESYLEVLRQRQLVLIARQNVAEHLEIRDLITDGVAAGRSTQADLEQIKARIAQARATEADSTQALLEAEAQFRREVGDAPGQLQMPPTPYELLSEDVDSEVLISLSRSPTLDIFESDIEVAYAESEQTKSTFYPQVDLVMNARQGEDLGGVEGVDKGASALLQMNWNLYRGGGDMARAREFVHRHQRAKEERADAARQLESDVRQTWAQMIAAGERAGQFAAQADANTEVVRAYKDQFTLGRRTLLDVLDAQNELFVSRSNTVNAEFVEMISVYRLVALKGGLFNALGVDYAAETVVTAEESWSEKERIKAR